MMKKYQYLTLSFICSFLLCPFVVFAQMPDDPFVEQWSYEHTGVYEAWDYATGSKDVIVAVIDNGFDIYHPDLRDNVWQNDEEIVNNGIDDDGNGYIDDVYGWNFLDDNNNPRPNLTHLTEKEKEAGVFNHGTVVAGIIGAKGNNGRDGVGINWDVKLMNLKVLGNSGSGDLAPLADAIYYAVDNGADIVNVSMVGTGDITDIISAIDYAYDNNVLIVAAAGNNLIFLNESPRYPVCIDEDLSIEKVIGVSAITEAHRLAIFSNSGSDCIDITAPGVDVKSTLFLSPENDLNETYSQDVGWNGTSFSTPLISGAAALIKSLQPSWGPDEIFNALISTVQHTPGQDEEVYANLFGAGLLQIDNAVKFAAGEKVEVPTNVIPEKKPSTQKINQIPQTYDGDERMMFISSDTGEYEKRTRGKDEVTITKRLAFENLEDIERFELSDGSVRYVTLRQKSEGVHLVSIYDSNLRRQDRWEFVGEGMYDIAVGDLLGTYEPEILLSPKQADEVYVYVYKLDGSLIDYLVDAAHEGVSVDVVYDEVWEVYDIVLVYIYEGTTFIERIESESFYSIDAFWIEGVQGDRVSVGDVDNDGADEYVISARAGKQARIYAYEQDGSPVVSFRAYPASYKRGVYMDVFDYNGDGSNELVVTPQGGEMPVRMYTSRGRLIEEWYAFNAFTEGPLLVTQL